MCAADLAVYTPDRQQEIVQLMGFKGTPEQTTLLFKLAEHYRLDPLTKEIALIPGKGPFIGVWGRLHIGHRSGDLDGFEADDEWEDSGFYKVRCVVWRKSMSRPAAKVIGRVADREKKDWPFEIARARAVRAAFGYAFNIHDSFDAAEDDWGPPPDERLDGTIVDTMTGEIVAAAPEEVVNGETAAAPKRRRKQGEMRVGSEPTSGPGQDDHGTAPTAPDPGPDTDPPTINVGGHTLAQKIAIAARDAGIDDDQTRWDVISAASGGRYARGRDIPEDADAARIFEAFAGLADGGVQLRYEPDGTPRLYRTSRR